MEKYDEDQLKILTYLNTYGFKPYDEIAAEALKLKLFEDDIQFGIFFREMEARLYIMKKVETVIVDSNDLYRRNPWGIHQVGKMRLLSLQKEFNSENAALGLNKKVSTWTIVGAIAGIIAAIGTIVTIFLMIYFANRC